MTWIEHDALVDAWTEGTAPVQTWTAAGALTDGWQEPTGAVVPPTDPYGVGIFGDDDVAIIGDDDEYIISD